MYMWSRYVDTDRLAFLVLLYEYPFAISLFLKTVSKFPCFLICSNTASTCVTIENQVRCVFREKLFSRPGGLLFPISHDDLADFCKGLLKNHFSAMECYVINLI